MSLAVSHILAQMRHELAGGDLSIELDKFGIINQAGHHLYSMHPWRWISGRSALLNLRGVLSGSTATWVAATKTFTQTGAFTNYSFQAGDELQTISGTGITSSVVKIASRTNNNSIVASTSISAVDLATGNINWRVDPQTIQLPADCRDIIWISSTSTSAVGGVTLTTLERILEARKASAAITSSTGLFYAAVVYSGEPPVPLLEIYPSASANATGAMRIFYRSRWTAVTADTQQINIPDFVLDLYIWIARAYVSGYERNDLESIHSRLAKIRNSPIFSAAARSDGMVQPYYGPIRGGGMQVWRRQSVPMPLLANKVDPPTL